MAPRIDISRGNPTAMDWYKLVKDRTGGEVRVTQKGDRKVLTVERGGLIGWVKRRFVSASRLQRERSEARALFKRQLSELLPDDHLERMPGETSGKEAIVLSCLGSREALSPRKVFDRLLRNNDQVREFDRFHRYTRRFVSLDRASRERELLRHPRVSSPRFQALFAEHVRLIVASGDTGGARRLGDETTDIGRRWRLTWQGANQPTVRKLLSELGRKLRALDKKAITAPVLGLRWKPAFDVMTRMQQGDLATKIYASHSEDIEYFMTDAKRMQNSSGELDERARNLLESIAALCRKEYGLGENEPPLVYFKEGAGKDNGIDLGSYRRMRRSSEAVVRVNIHPDALKLGLLKFVNTISHEYTHAYQHRLAGQSEWDSDFEKDAAEVSRLNFDFYLPPSEHSYESYKAQPVERHAFGVGNAVQQSILLHLANERFSQEVLGNPRG